MINREEYIEMGREDVSRLGVVGTVIKDIARDTVLTFSTLYYMPTAIRRETEGEENPRLGDMFRVAVMLHAVHSFVGLPVYVLVENSQFFLHSHENEIARGLALLGFSVFPFASNLISAAYEGIRNKVVSTYETRVDEIRSVREQKWKKAEEFEAMIEIDFDDKLKAE